MSTLSVPGFVKEVRKYGTFDANACLNCGSCTVICNLASNRASFPRRTLQQVLFGLKQSVRVNLDPWLCHDCGDCSLLCPRQAEPRASMATLRRYLTAQYDWTRISSKVLTAKLWHLAIMLFSMVLFFSLVLYYHVVEVAMPLTDFMSTEMGLEHMFGLITDFTSVLFVIPVVLMLVNIVRMYWFTMHTNRDPIIPLKYYLTELPSILVHMVSHKNIRHCVSAIHKMRWTTHWLLGLAVTAKVIIVLLFLDWFQTDSMYPIYHPQRWVGYLITVFIVYVSLEIIFKRRRKKEEIYKFSKLSDLTLPIMLLLIAVSGIAIHIFRYTELLLLAHYAYAFHIAFVVPLVLVEIPFGKGAHILYRPLALYFQAVKERALAAEKSSIGKNPTNDIVIKGTQPA